MQSPVWSPVSFCHPSHFLEALDPHWGPEFSDITPKALAQPRSCPPHRQMPSQDSLGHHLPLPVPVGAATPGVPEPVFILGPFLHGEGERSDFPGERRQETRKMLQPLALANQLHKASCFWGPAPATTLSRALMVACRRDRPGASACCPICAPELDEATVAASAEPPPSITSGLGPEQTRTSHALWTFCIFSNCHRKDDPKHECLRLQSHLALTGSSHAACLPSP